jgi:hypothetical protein
MTIWGALAGGVIGTVVLTTSLRGAQELGITRMDLPFLLGTVFTGNRSVANVLGYALHFVNGLLFALAYYGVFVAVGRAGWIFGAILGVVHGAFAGGALVEGGGAVVGGGCVTMTGAGTVVGGGCWMMTVGGVGIVIGVWTMTGGCANGVGCGTAAERTFTFVSEESPRGFVRKRKATAVAATATSATATTTPVEWPRRSSG